MGLTFWKRDFYILKHALGFFSVVGQLQLIKDIE